MPKQTIIMIFLLWAACGLSRAELLEKPAPDDSWKDRGEIRLGFLPSYFHYHQHDDLFAENGFLPGLRVEYLRYYPYYINLSARMHYGSLAFDGHRMDDTPYSSATRDHIYEVRALIGGDFSQPDDDFGGLSWRHRRTDPEHALVLYTGLGYRFWNNETTASHGYERELSYLYLPLGIDFTMRSHDDSRLSLKFEFDVPLAGGVTRRNAYMTNPHDPSMKSSGCGARASIAYEIPVGRAACRSSRTYSSGIIRRLEAGTSTTMKTKKTIPLMTTMTMMRGSSMIFSTTSACTSVIIRWSVD